MSLHPYLWFRQKIDWSLCIALFAVRKPVLHPLSHSDEPCCSKLASRTFQWNYLLSLYSNFDKVHCFSILLSVTFMLHDSNYVSESTIDILACIYSGRTPGCAILLSEVHREAPSTLAFSSKNPQLKLTPSPFSNQGCTWWWSEETHRLVPHHQKICASYSLMVYEPA